MAKRWVNFVGMAPLLLGMMVAVPQMVVAPLVLAQNSQTNQNRRNSQFTEAQSLFNEGERLRQQGTRESLQQALEKYQQALSLFRATANRRWEAALHTIGFVYSSIDQPQRALEFYQQALPIRREVNDRSGEANTLSNLAFLQRSLKDLPAALQNIQAAIKIVEDIRGPNP